MAKAPSPWPKRTMVANTDLNRLYHEVGGEPGARQDGNDAIQQNPAQSALQGQTTSKASRSKQPK
ncbi:MAG: hypothetical protein M1602_05985 [Firmicutes bacterium]|nr:hypothetical protein [Bacillota bacterium]